MFVCIVVCKSNLQAGEKNGRRTSGDRRAGRVGYALQRVSQSSHRYHVWITRSSFRRKKISHDSVHARASQCVYILLHVLG